MTSLYYLNICDMSKQSCDAVIDLAVEGFELGDIELLADQVLMGFLVCLVEDRRNRSESEFLKNLRHKIRLHLAAASSSNAGRGTGNERIILALRKTVLIILLFPKAGFELTFGLIIRHVPEPKSF